MNGWGWVAVQVLLLAGLGLAPAGPPWPALGGGGAGLLVALGVGAAGIGLGRALVDLANSFRVNPVPREGAPLVTTGLYGIVRHPMYSLVLLGAGCIAFTGFSPWRWAVFAALALFFWLKARHEEGLLAQAHAGYSEYKRRVGMFYPRPPLR